MKKLSLTLKKGMWLVVIGLVSCGESKQNEIKTEPAVDSTQIINEVEKEVVVEYKTVSINGIEWMEENLNVNTFKNGDTIMQAQDPAEWMEAGKKELPAWCYYENKEENGTAYGKLYNWYAVTDPRGLAPEGYRIPTLDDFISLIKAFGGEKKAGTALKAKDGWAENGNGTNESGLNVIASGTRAYNGGFSNLLSYGYLWTSTDQRDFNAWHLALNHKNAIGKTYPSLKGGGFSVRCIKE